MEITAARPYKRRLRNVLIHKPIQREFTLVVLSLLIVSALAVAFVIHSTIREALMGGGYRFGTVSPYEVMADVSYDLIYRVSLILFLTLLVIVVFGVFFLHRVAGPVYRFQSVLRRMAHGEVPDDVHLREGDYFTETADDLNHVLRLLRERQDRIHALESQLVELFQKNALSPTLLVELREGLNQLL